MKKINGYFMQPQNFSVNDGDGIRTIIFFAGCPLRCKWCSNPEGLININNKGSHDYNELIYNYTSEDILEIIEKQKIFYRHSGGGVTFSGGEATFQGEILRELVFKLYDKAINLAIESSGYFEFEEVKDVLEKMDLIFIDIKHMDEDKHRSITGVSNKKILENIKQVDKLNVPIIIRIPVIVGVNGDKENIRETAKFVKENIKDPKIELLPYHSLGDSKYESLGLKLPSRDFNTPSDDYLQELEDIIKSEGVIIVSFR